MFTCKVDTKSIEKKMLALGSQAIKILNEELKPMAKEAMGHVKNKAPKRSGMLRRTFRLKKIKKKKKYTVGFRVKAVTPPEKKAPKKGKEIKPRKKKPNAKRNRYYAFAPNYGVTKGRGKQPAQEFFSKGLAEVAAKLPDVQKRIMAKVRIAWKKRA